MRRLKKVEKRKPGEFRLLLRIGIDGVRTPEEALEHAAGINLVRFRKHLAKLTYRLYWDAAMRKISLKARRRRRALALKARGGDS
jgi:hypothetical protein